MNIFHILPNKKDVCGGVKVHYQLCELERSLGYTSYIVFDDISIVPTWFDYTVQHITVADMHKMANKKRDVIVGWEDAEILLRSGFHNKVSYIQGEVFINRSNPYHGITIWFSNDFNRVALPHLADNDTFVVTPPIDNAVFNYSLDVDWNSRQHMFSIQDRKAGQDARLHILAELENESEEFLEDICCINVIRDCTEKEFASQLRDTKIFIAHTFPEGMGLPALEAMASGCFVVGFTGGGGTVYMEHGNNCLIAQKDGDYKALGKMLGIAFSMVQGGDMKNFIREATATANRFSKEHTMQQLKTALHFFEDKD